MSQEFKLANCRKERKVRLKMHLIEQISYDLIPQHENEKKSGRWKMPKKDLFWLFVRKNKTQIRLNCSKGLKVARIKCRDKSESQLSRDKQTQKSRNFYCDN